ARQNSAAAASDRGSLPGIVLQVPLNVPVHWFGSRASPGSFVMLSGAKHLWLISADACVQMDQRFFSGNCGIRMTRSHVNQEKKPAARWRISIIWSISSIVL